MFFVVDRRKLRKAIRLARDDRSAKTQSKTGPFFRIEAADGRLRLAGHRVQADIPATVYEPGVLFLRITLLRRAIDMLLDEKTLAVQVNADGLHIDALTIALESNEMLLYPDPVTAPAMHPLERLPVEEPAKPPAPERELPRGGLFG